METLGCSGVADFFRVVEGGIHDGSSHAQDATLIDLSATPVTAGEKRGTREWCAVVVRDDVLRLIQQLNAGL